MNNTSLSLRDLRSDFLPTTVGSFTGWLWMSFLLLGTLCFAQPYDTSGNALPNSTALSTNGQGGPGSPAFCQMKVGWSGSLNFSSGGNFTVYANVFFTGGGSYSYVRYVQYSVDGGARQTVFNNPGGGWGGWNAEVGEWRVFAISIPKQSGNHTVTVYSANGYTGSETSGTFSYSYAGGNSAPTVSWHTLPPTSLTSGNWYAARATGSDSNGNLGGVWVEYSSNGGASWNALAYDPAGANGGNGYNTTTNNNGIVAGSGGTVYQFRCYAWDQSGANSGWVYSGYHTVATPAQNQTPSITMEILNGSQQPISPSGSVVNLAYGATFYARLNGYDPEGRLEKLQFRGRKPNSNVFAEVEQGASGGSASRTFGPYTADMAGTWNLWSHVKDLDSGAYPGGEEGNGNGWASAGLPDLQVASMQAPTITGHPAHQSKTVGSSATFSVSVDGSPSFTYQWRKNGTNISGATGASYTISSVQTSHAGSYSVVVSNAAGSATSNGATLTVIPAASGTGLTGSYFPNRTLTGSANTTRTDATINFDWGNGSPLAGIGSDNFSVRWQGEIQAPTTGTFTYTTTSDDGIRLWINNQLLIQNWTDHAPTNNSASVALTAGQKYPIKIEYYENGGGAVAKLLWQYPGVGQQIVPANYLYPAGAGTGAPSVPTNLDYTNVGASGLSLIWDASAGGNAPITYEVRKGSASYQSNLTNATCWVSASDVGQSATFSVRAKNADGIWSDWSSDLTVWITGQQPGGTVNDGSFWVDLPWSGASGGDGILDEVHGGGTSAFNYSVGRWYSNWNPPSDVFINSYFRSLDLWSNTASGLYLYDDDDTPAFDLSLTFGDFAWKFEWEWWIYDALLSENYETDYELDVMINLPDDAWWTIYQDTSEGAEIDFENWEPLLSGNGFEVGPDELITLYFMGASTIQNQKLFLVEHGKALGSLEIELDGRTLVLNADGSIGSFGLPSGMGFSAAESFVKFEIDNLVVEVVTDLAVNVLKAAGVPVSIGTPVTLSNGTTILLDAAGNVEVTTTGGWVVKGNIHTKGGSIVGPSSTGVPGAGWGIEILPNGTTRIIAPVGASAVTQIVVRAINAAGKALQEGAGALWVLKDIWGNSSSVSVGNTALELGVNSSGAVQLGVQVGDRPPVWFYFGKPVLRPDTDWSGDIGEYEDTSVSRRYILVPNEGDENPAIPGDDAANLVVDGQADIDDFHPVVLDLRAMLVNYPEGGNYTYQLSHAESALNFVYTRLNRGTAFDYLTDSSATYGPNRNQPLASATVVPITAVGINLSNDFLKDIREQDKGVILVEAKHWTEQPLVLDVLDGNTLIDRVYLHIGKMGLWVDANRDGILGENETATEDMPFRFWSNDDMDAGDVEGDDIPGKGIVTGEGEVYFGFSANYATLLQGPNAGRGSVDGTRDLIDFFPVFLDIKQLLGTIPHTTAGITYKLKHADGALNFVYTNKSKAQAFDYQKQILATGFGPAFTQAAGEASTERITADGTALNTTFLDGVKNNDWGVILVEGRLASTSPLRLVVEKYGAEIGSVALNTTISAVEDMYRRINLRDANGQPPANLVGDLERRDEDLGLPTSMGEPPAYPDNLTNGKWFVFVVGSNVGGQKMRGWQSEIFKRLHWSKSKARFVGVSWFGDPFDDSSDLVYNYHSAVRNAFASAGPLTSIVNGLPGTKTIAGHSAGAVVISSAVADHGLNASNTCLLDAAMGRECYDGASADNITAMVPAPWQNYPSELWASRWHLRFAGTGDARQTLTWRDRFVDVLNQTIVHNFYSATEEVLGRYDGTVDQSIIENLRAPGSFAWVIQEKAKGDKLRLLFNQIKAGSDYMGWGHNLNDPITANLPKWYLPDTYNGLRLPKPPAQIGTVTPQLLDDSKIQPFFLTGWGTYYAANPAQEVIDTDPAHNTGPSWIFDLYGVSTGSAIAADAVKHTQLLNEAIPALSLALGSTSSDRLPVARNYNMPDIFADRAGWPRSLDGATNLPRWHHSDMREVAYLYLSGLYDELSSIANQ